MRHYIAMALVVNKKAAFDYSIIEEMEAGFELIGTAGKALRH